MNKCDVCVLVCVHVYLYMQWPQQLFSPLLQVAQTFKQFADEETYSERLMLEGDFETLIDNAESGVDEYMAFKDTMSG